MALLVAPTIALGQAGSRLVAEPLGPAVARVADEFVQVGDVVELPDGRVLITDTREYRLVLADMARGVARVLGRTGSGPGEYRWIDGLYRRPDGGALMLDPALQRLLPIRLDGTFESPIAIPSGLLLRGVSDDGSMYGEKFFPRTATGMADSMYIVRWRPAQGRLDTLAAWDAGVSKSVGRGAMAAFPPLDTWTVLGRGDIMYVSALRYTVSIRRGATTLTSRAIPFDAVKWTLRDEAIYTSERNAERAVRLGSPGAPAPSAPPPPTRTFPNVLPPFGGGGLGGRYLYPSRHGHVWLARLAAPSAPLRHYDVLDDRTGALRHIVSLARNARVVGFGVSAVYVAQPDDDGIERVTQHTYPRIGDERNRPKH